MTEPLAMMALGNYRFSLDTAAFQKMARTTESRWPSYDPIGTGVGHQYIGPGMESITLAGVIFPAYKGGLDQIKQMREEAETGTSHLLMKSDGEILGMYIIKRVEETQEHFLNGGIPQKIEFTLSLERTAEK